jgi:hypothetical protein
VLLADPAPWGVGSAGDAWSWPGLRTFFLRYFDGKLEPLASLRLSDPSAAGRAAEERLWPGWTAALPAAALTDEWLSPPVVRHLFAADFPPAAIVADMATGLLRGSLDLPLADATATVAGLPVLIAFRLPWCVFSLGLPPLFEELGAVAWPAGLEVALRWCSQPCPTTFHERQFECIGKLDIAYWQV